MPTIDIPDKICIKCGSTRWKVNSNTGYKRCTDCANTNQRKYYKKEYYRDRYHKNIEKHRELARVRQTKHRKSNRSKLYSKHNIYMDIKRKELGDLYIKCLLAKHSKGLSLNDITPELIELKRKQLLLKRKIKELCLQ